MGDTEITRNSIYNSKEHKEVEDRIKELRNKMGENKFIEEYGEDRIR